MNLFMVTNKFLRKNRFPSWNRFLLVPIPFAKGIYSSPKCQNRPRNWNCDSFGIGIDTALVQVYFKSLNVQRVQESPSYQFADGSLMSSLGGAISLYLGIALAMIFEVIELIIDFFINCFMDNKIKRKM